MAKHPFESEKGFFYCATCGNLGPDEQGYPIGTPFECPTDRTHFAEVVKPPAGEFWLRAEKNIWNLQRFSPMKVFRNGGRAGLYHFVRLIVLIVAVLTANLHGSWFARYVPVLASIYFLYDIVLLSTYATFVSRYPAHPLRSLTLNLSSFFQCALAYAVAYKLAGDLFSRSLDTVDSIYFSVVTISTVGYGDIQVLGSLHRAWVIELLIVSEIMIGLYMLAGLLAVVAGWANQMPVARSPKPLGMLRKPPSAEENLQLGTRG
jgi:hypothetical protein